MTLVTSTITFIFFASVFAVVAFFASMMIVPLLMLSFFFAGLVVIFNGLSYITYRLASSEYSHTVLFLNRTLRNLADNLPPSVGIVEVGSSTKTVKSAEVVSSTQIAEETRFTFKSVVERYIAKAKYFPLLITKGNKPKERDINSSVESVLKEESDQAFDKKEEIQSEPIRYIVDDDREVVPEIVVPDVKSEPTIVSHTIPEREEDDVIAVADEL